MLQGPSHRHPTQNGGFVSRQGGGMTPQPATQNHGFAHTRFASYEPLVLSDRGLWTKQLDFDTYAMPETLIWGDLHHLVRLSVWEGSGPKMEGSATIFGNKVKSILQQQLSK